MKRNCDLFITFTKLFHKATFRCFSVSMTFENGKTWCFFQKYFLKRFREKFFLRIIRNCNGLFLKSDCQHQPICNLKTGLISSNRASVRLVQLLSARIKCLFLLFCLPQGFLPVVGPTERWWLRHLVRPCNVALGRALVQKLYRTPGLG